MENTDYDTPPQSAPGAGSPVLVPKEFLTVPPSRIKRPCDYGLELAVKNLITQLGTVEAFNRLTAAAAALRARIAGGDIAQPVSGTAEPGGN